MGLLDNLWDDTVAGPRPKGLAKLRRYDSNPITRSTPITSSNDHDVPVPVTRSITILKNSSNSARNTAESSSVPSSYNSSVLSSPTGSSTPSSPFSPGTPRGVYQKRLMRRKSTNSAALERAEPRSPTVYDWMVISALDR